jgi:tetratricopeptide (TPR) repeat protein
MKLLKKQRNASDLNKTIRLLNPPPQSISAVYQNLAEAYNDLYKFPEALSSLLKAYELNPNDTLMMYKIGSQYDYKIKNKPLALKYYNDFMKTRPPKKENQGNPLVISYYDVAERRILELKKESSSNR